MKRIYYIISALFLAAAVFTGCSKDEIEEKYLDVIESDVDFQASGGTGVISLSTNADRVIASSNEYWLRITSASPEAVEFEVSDHSGEFSRAARISVYGGGITRQIVVSQMGVVFAIGSEDIENGISNVELLAYTVPIENSITIQTRSIMGTEIPHVKYVPDAGKPTYAFSTTHESIDKAREAFRKVKELTIKLSMVENSAYRLATNIRKTQKRANALKNITIPMYQKLVKDIGNALEEKEREEFTRLKVIKGRKTE